MIPVLIFWGFFFFYLSKNIYIIYQVILKWWKRMSRCKSARKNWNCAEWIQIWIGKGRPLILSEKKYIILVKIAMFTKIIHKKLLKMIIIICLRWVLLLELFFFLVWNEYDESNSLIYKTILDLHLISW